MDRVQSKILIISGILYAVFSLVMIKFLGNFSLLLLFGALIMVALGAYWYSKAPIIPKSERTKNSEMTREDFIRRGNIPGYIQYKYLGEKRKGIVMFVLFIIGLSLFALSFYISFHNFDVSDLDDYIWIGPFVLLYAIMGVHFPLWWSMIDINAYCNRMNMPSEYGFWFGWHIKNTKRAMIILVLCTVLLLIGLTIFTLKESL